MYGSPCMEFYSLCLYSSYFYIFIYIFLSTSAKGLEIFLKSFKHQIQQLRKRIYILNKSPETRKNFKYYAQVYQF